MTQLKTICARCQVLIRDGALDKDGHCSHSLCDACTDVQFPNSRAAQNRRFMRAIVWTLALSPYGGQR